MTLPVHPELGSDFDYGAALTELSLATAGEHPAPAAQSIAEVIVQLGALLLKKNTAYGDSALKPVEVFARGLSPSERMAVRMDDKISRLARGAADGEDVEMDLAGYIVLQRIARAEEDAQEVEPVRGGAFTPLVPPHKAAQQRDIETLNTSIQQREQRDADYQARIADEQRTEVPF
jgi:hypothetical protein